MQVKTGSGNKGLDWAFILGMIAAYPKTADLLSLFSPQILNDIFGMDMSLPYGGFCALLVEGVILFLHFDRRAHFSTSAQTVKWILTIISLGCQVFDGWVTTDTIAQQSDVMKAILSYGIPALPLLIAIMISTIGALPEGDEVQVARKPRVGLKTRLDNFWYGENTRVSVKVGEPKFIPEPEPEPEPLPEPVKGNGSNFTSRRS